MCLSWEENSSMWGGVDHARPCGCFQRVPGGASGGSAAQHNIHSEAHHQQGARRLADAQRALTAAPLFGVQQRPDQHERVVHCKSLHIMGVMMTTNMQPSIGHAHANRKGSWSLQKLCIASVTLCGLQLWSSGREGAGRLTRHCSSCRRYTISMVSNP